MSHLSGFLFTVVLIPGVYAGLAYYAADNSSARYVSPDKAAAFAALVALPLVLSGLVKWWDIWKRPKPHVGEYLGAMPPGQFVTLSATTHAFCVVGLVLLLVFSAEAQEKIPDPEPFDSEKLLARLIADKQSTEQELAKLKAAEDAAPERKTLSDAARKEAVDLDRQRRTLEGQIAAHEATISRVKNERADLTAFMNQKFPPPLGSKQPPSEQEYQRRITQMDRDIQRAETDLDRLRPDLTKTKASLKELAVPADVIAADGRRDEMTSMLRGIEAKIQETKQINADEVNKAAQRQTDMKKSKESLFLPALVIIVLFTSFSVPRRTGYASGEPISY